MLPIGNIAKEVRSRINKANVPERDGIDADTRAFHTCPCIRKIKKIVGRHVKNNIAPTDGALLVG